VLDATPLAQLSLVNYSLNWVALGLAFLVPADVSLSVWFFYLLTRVEFLISAWAGSTLHQGAGGSQLVRWQRAGAYMAFTVGALYLARRHIMDVLRKAFWRGKDVDDRAEPVGFRLGFWGMLVCSTIAVLWFCHYGMSTLAAVLWFLLLMCTQFVHARVVAQSGLYRIGPLSLGPGLLQALSFGHLFTNSGIVLSHMQFTAMMHGNNSMLGPAALHSFRISEVFEKRRKLLLPVLIAALAAAIVAAAFTCIYQGYSGGGVNFSNQWAVIANPRSCFDAAHRMLEDPAGAVEVRWFPLSLGVGLTSITMFMRARFYWWPIHPIGTLALAGYGLDRMWLSFFLGWLIKVALVRLGTGRMLRGGRLFFIGFVISECFVYSAWSVVSMITRGGLPGAGLWI
jgi:hypothetical protein